MPLSFIHLNVHSEFSLVDGIVRLKPLVKSVAAMGMPAVAVSDICNLYGLVKFYKAAQSEGIKPLCAAQMQMRNDQGDVFRLCLYVMNETGYQNLVQLISRAWQSGQVHGQAYIQREWLTEFNEGLIALSGAGYGDIGRALLAGRQEQAADLLEHWMSDFPGRFYIELQRTGRPDEAGYIQSAVQLAAQHRCPVVATNDVCFLTEDEFEAHEARVCINEGRTLADPRRERRYTAEQYLKTPEQMVELFSDIPGACQNTVEIARRCNLGLTLGKSFLPEYPIPDGLTEETFFRQVSCRGLEERLAVLLDPHDHNYQQKRKIYEERLAFELDVIIQMGFPGYFLIVMDFIQWAKEQGIPVGPGRGSGAGSLVAYALKITDLDPLAYDLLFERFLNPERVSMPDFDIDFCMDGRDRVIAYVADTYGRDAVSQIITFGTMAAKAVVRDVARVQGKAYAVGDRLSKMIPFEVGMTLAKAVEREEPLRDMLEEGGEKYDEEALEVWEMAVQLEGITRNVGKHAGGVVIAPDKLTDFCPLYCDESGEGLVTQFDKDDVEQVGLVKFDFLGLRTLTIIDWARQMINRRLAESGEAELVIEKIPLDDHPTFELLQRAETTAVFQLESRGMKELIKKLAPSCFEDIVALVALYRPGPLQSGMVDDFINRKHGREPVSYPHPHYQHPDLEPVLRPTYGIILYQEQVMQIAQVLARFTLGGADLLRRAMGKKKPEVMAEQRKLFIQGALENNLNEDLAGNIFDLMEKFAGYGFNKSHSAAYALVSYQTAWLKTHYPAEFMAAVLSADMQNTDKVVTLIEECRSMKLQVTPPNVNDGEFAFTVDRSMRIIYGLGAIKGLGEGPVDAIIAARKTGGPFRDLFDFCERVDLKKINKRALEALIRSGAFDELGPADPSPEKPDPGYGRSVMFHAVADAVKLAEQSAHNQSSGMVDLFGETLPGNDPEGEAYTEYLSVRPWSMRERLRSEKETLGLYLTGHPIDEYISELRRFVPGRIVDLKPERQTQVVAGLVVSMVVRKNQSGNEMATLTLDDRSGRMEVTFFNDAFSKYRDILVKDTLLVVEGNVREDDYNGGMSMRVTAARTIAEARQSYVRALQVSISSDVLTESTVSLLDSALQPYTGGTCPVIVQYETARARGCIKLGDQWSVSPEDELLQHLAESFGKTAVQLLYLQ